MSAVAAAHGIKLGGRELALLCQKVEVGRGAWHANMQGKRGKCQSHIPWAWPTAAVGSEGGQPLTACMFGCPLPRCVVPHHAMHG